MSLKVVRPVTGFPITQLWGQIAGAARGVRNANGANGHPGVDYGCPNGTPVLALADGVVIYAGPASGFGDHLVSIWHPQFGVTSRYGHMQSHLVLTGQQVTAGVQVGISNNQGQSTGPHLHFEVGVGQLIDAGNPPNIDPEAWIVLHQAAPVIPALSAQDRAYIGRMQYLLGVAPDQHWGKITDLAYQTLRWKLLCNAQGYVVSDLAAGLAHPRRWPVSSTVQAMQHDVFHFTAADQDGIYGPKTDAAWELCRLCWLGK